MRCPLPGLPSNRHRATGIHGPGVWDEGRCVWTRGSWLRPHGCCILGAGAECRRDPEGWTPAVVFMLPEALTEKAHQ